MQFYTILIPRLRWSCWHQHRFHQFVRHLILSLLKAKVTIACYNYIRQCRRETRCKSHSNRKNSANFWSSEAVVVLGVFVEIKDRQKLCGEYNDWAQEKFKPLFSFPHQHTSLIATWSGLACRFVDFWKVSKILHYKGGFINAQQWHKRLVWIGAKKSCRLFFV